MATNRGDAPAGVAFVVVAVLAAIVALILWGAYTREWRLGD